MLKRILIWSLVILTCGCAAAQKPPTPQTADSTKTEDVVKEDAVKTDTLSPEVVDEIVEEEENEKKPSKKSNYNEDLSTVRPIFEPIVVADTTEKLSDTTFVEDIDMEVTHEIDSVIKRVQDYNLAHPPKLKGYRIQVYSGGNQTDAYNAVDVSKEVLGNDIYHKVQWTSPVFRSRVGCFISRLEAYKAFRLLEKDFPNALVVPDNHIEPGCVK